MAGTIIADFIRTDANQLSLNVGNTTFATINASGFFSNTGTQIIAANGRINAASIVSGSIPGSALSTAANTIPRSSMTSGAVLQVIQTTSTSAISTSSSSYQASGIIASITPTSSTSKIFVVVTGGGGYNSGSNVGGDNKIYRQIASGGYSALAANEVDWCGPQASGTTIVVPHSFAYLDSPATTSTVYYQPYYRVNPVGAGGTYHFNVNYYNNMIGKIAVTLMEIAV